MPINYDLVEEEFVSIQSDFMPGIGHNNPPSLAEELTAKHTDLFSRATQLGEAESRMPEKITDENQGDFTNFAKQAKTAAKALESAHEVEKAPHLDNCRVIDGLFKPTATALVMLAKRVESKLTMFLTQKAAAERAAREAEAARQREESERLAREAAIKEDCGLTESAAQTMVQAQTMAVSAAKVEQSAQAKPADLARSRGSLGSVGSLRQQWKGEVTDRTTLDLEALRPFFDAEALQKAINGWVKLNCITAGLKADSVVPVLKGAKVELTSSAVVR